jgi:hypothetical protein
VVVFKGQVAVENEPIDACQYLRGGQCWK